MTIELKLINGESKYLDISPSYVQDHFNVIQNCTDPILKQTNNNYYDKYITSDDKIIVDLGANIGLVSMHLMPYAKKIISVEPTPNHFKILEYFTHDIPNIYRLCGAISDKRGTSTFFMLHDSTENSLVDKRGGMEIQVETYTLKDIIDLYDIDTIDFLKIDIEGSEIQFLSDNNIDTMNKHVKKFFIEFHDVNGLSYTQYREKYQNIFKEMGWNVELISVDVLYCYK